MTYTENFLEEVKQSIDRLDKAEIEKMIDFLVSVRNTGRLFIIGSGGGAGHASHAVADFRKLCNIESYAPYDNISETTARINDNGWDTSIADWLIVSRFNKNDCLMVISVGGGQDGVSENITEAVLYARATKAKILGIVGKMNSYTTQYADICIRIKSENTTPITEGLQSVIWHLIVSHPRLMLNKAVW